MLDLFIDADACPVKDEALKVARRHGLTVHLVGNRWVRADGDPAIRRVVVPEGPDAADDWIVEHVTTDDIVVTQDIRLAARCLEKRAQAIGPTGRPFTADNIGMAVAMRELNAHLREIGEIKGGGAGIGPRDRSRFLESLEQIVQAIRRRS
ncbi:MAG: YaiI/YqxD family protein [Alphaproteobacteria bacterium]|nr:YaiI/YqxD family protein [Alphaproteobacteria bacterium]